MDMIVLIKFALAMSSTLFISVIIFIATFLVITQKIISVVTNKPIKKPEPNKYLEKYKHYYYGFIILAYLLLPLTILFLGVSNIQFTLLDIIVVTVVMLASAIFLCYGLMELLLNLILEQKLDERETMISRKSLRTAMLVLLLLLSAIYMYNSLIRSIVNENYSISNDIDTLTLINLIFFVISVAWIGSYVYYTKLGR